MSKDVCHLASFLSANLSHSSLSFTFRVPDSVRLLVPLPARYTRLRISDSSVLDTTTHRWS